MAVTLIESAKSTKDDMQQAVVRVITERSPLARIFPFKSISGSAYRFDQEVSLPTVATRAIGSTYTASQAVDKPIVETLSILGGEVILDNFIVRTQGNIRAEKAKQYERMASALSIKFDSLAVNGDADASPNDFNGLLKRVGSLASAQTVDQGTSALTLAKLNQTIDQVYATGRGTKHLFMNATLLRKIWDLISATNGTFRIEVGQDEFGMPVEKYRGVPIHVLEHGDDASTILGFTEASSTASIYCVNLDNENGVFGIVGGGNGGVLPTVQDFGEIQAAPRHLGRIEWYVGMACAHPRAIARLKGITNA